MEFDIDDDTTVAEITRKSGVFISVCRRLTEHIAPADTTLLVYLARQIAPILLLESLFEHGFCRHDLADYHARLCRDRDRALKRLKITL